MSGEERSKRFIEAGAEFALGGAAILAQTAGFDSLSTLSPILTPAVLAVVSEFSGRILGPRESSRAAGALLFATRRLAEIERSGISVRDDGFFNGSSASRSSGEEVIEAVLHAAQQSHEEQKVTYYGNLLAAIAVNPSISRSLANHLVKTSQLLSYTQLCLIHISINKHRYQLRESGYLSPDDPSGKKYYVEVSSDMDDILSQIVDLWSRQIISMGDNSSISPSMFSLVPSEITAREIGAHLYNNMLLHRLPDHDVARIADLLRADTKIAYTPVDPNTALTTRHLSSKPLNRQSRR